MFTSSELRRRDEKIHVACVLLSALTEMLWRLKKVTNKEVINKAALGKEKQRNTVNSSRVTFHLQNNSESRCGTSTVFSKSTLVGCRFSQQQHRVLDGCKSALQSCCWLQPDMHDGLCRRVDAVFRELGFKPDTLCHDHTFWSLFFFSFRTPYNTINTHPSAIRERNVYIVSERWSVWRVKQRRISPPSSLLVLLLTHLVHPEVFPRRLSHITKH